MQAEESKQQVSGFVLHRAAPWAVLAIIAVGYFGLVASSAWNLPISDDYGILGLIARVHTGEFSWAEFWAPHNEHRIVWTRGVMLAASWLGPVNFVGLMIFGNLGWLGCAWLLGREAARRAGSLWAAVPVAALLAVPSHQENMLWAMASLQNYWSLFFVLAALQLLAARKDTAALGMLAAALLTSGGAMAALPGLLLLPFARREWRRLAVVAVASLVLVSAYAIGLRTQSSPPANSWLAGTHYFANFMGGTIPWAGLAPGVGVGLTVALAALVLRLKEDGFCGTLAVFVLVTGGLAVVTRVSFGVEQALASRYAVFSLLAAAAAWLACLGRAKPAVLRWGGGLLVVGAVAMTAQVFRSGRWERHWTVVPMEYYKVASRTPSHVHLQQFLDQARAAGIYQAPDLSDVVGQVRCRKLPVSFRVPSGSKIESWVDRYDGAYVNGWARRPGQSSLGQVVWVVLSNEQGAWRVPTWSYDRPDMVVAGRGGRNYLQAGFEAELPLFHLPTGRYDISILLWNDGDWGVEATPYTYGVGVPRAELKIRD